MTNTSLSLMFAGQTDIGYVRENNEDAWRALPEHQFFLLADGMGGLQGGEIASKSCVEHLITFIAQIDQEIKRKTSSIKDVMDVFGAAIEKVNDVIYAQSKEKQPLQGMGTTLCSLYFFQDAAIYAHVGDSRIYRYRNSPVEIQLQQLTEDHSLVNELVLLGELTQKEAIFSPYKHILTRAIGINPHVEPAISWVPVKPNDLFLICSDGLTNYAADEEIHDVLSRIFLDSGSSMEKRLQVGMNQLISLAKSHGGGDNITVILILAQYNDLLR